MEQNQIKQNTSESVTAEKVSTVSGNFCFTYTHAKLRASWHSALQTYLLLKYQNAFLLVGIQQLPACPHTLLLPWDTLCPQPHSDSATEGLTSGTAGCFQDLALP